MIILIIIAGLTAVSVYAFGQARGNLNRAIRAEALLADKKKIIENLVDENCRQGFYLSAAENKVKKLTEQVRTMSER